MDKNKLRAALILRGITIDEICETLGISRSSWFRKLAGETEFTRTEIALISRKLSLDEAEMLSIFFDDACIADDT